MPVGFGGIFCVAVVFFHDDQGISEGGNFLELPPYFFNHRHCRPAYSVHGQRGEHERKHAANEEAGHYIGLTDINSSDTRLLRKCSEQSQGSEGSRSDGKAFTDSRGSVSYGIKFIGSFSHFLGEFRHFGYPAGIIRNRSVGVYGQLYAGIGKHTHGRNSNTIESCKVKRDQNCRHNKNNGNSGRHHTHA